VDDYTFELHRSSVELRDRSVELCQLSHKLRQAAREARARSIALSTGAEVSVVEPSKWPPVARRPSSLPFGDVEAYEQIA